jgi:hypothetical protein
MKIKRLLIGSLIPIACYGMEHQKVLKNVHREWMLRELKPQLMNGKSPNKQGAFPLFLRLPLFRCHATECGRFDYESTGETIYLLGSKVSAKKTASNNILATFLLLYRKRRGMVDENFGKQQPSDAPVNLWGKGLVLFVDKEIPYGKNTKVGLRETSTQELEIELRDDSKKRILTFSADGEYLFASKSIPAISSDK